MKGDTGTSDILQLAYGTEQLAMELYRQFSGMWEDEEFSHFWREFSEEERSHPEFWRNLSVFGTILTTIS
ncbi:MAG: hypothetical protein AVO35_07610 [Candidatus Aegiribacteria sp. MLS_C]|nr:MAG: hypothetical protein AVO35_07610 [Candidatus Aegiribacteria sp. MLS_C]